MTKAFCPGHITCFFAPVRTGETLTTGSIGAGIRLNKGTTVTLEERSGTKIRITMDGLPAKAEITERVIRRLAPGRGFDVTVENELPVSQGLGMSAAGAVAAGLCASSVSGMSEYDAYREAHAAETELGGGLGDVAGIWGGAQTVRVSAGAPPFGKVIDTGIRMKFTVAVLGPGLMTKSVLSDTSAMERISACGERCVKDFLNTQTEKRLYELASVFSSSIGLETEEMSEALSLLRRENSASMCMLGNSLFTDASEHKVRDILGGTVSVIPCSTGTEGAGIIRKA